LGEYLQTVKVRYPEARDIVGIGTGAPEDEDSAEDLLYLEAYRPGRWDLKVPPLIPAVGDNARLAEI
jgi:hypothetical protein